MEELRDSFYAIEDKLRDLFNRVNQLEAAPLITSSSGGGAPVDAEYLVLAFNAVLTQERRLDFSARFATVDGGAGGDYDVDLAASGVVPAVYGSATQVSQVTVDTYGRVTNAANVAIAGVPPLAHPLLGNTYHNDVATDAPTRGSLIVGNSTPLWDELVIGGAGTVLYSDGNDPSWSTLGAAGIAPSNATYIVVSVTPDLSNERYLAAGAGLDKLDGGAGLGFSIFMGTPSTLTAATGNGTTATSHTHAITTSSDGTANPSTIAAFNASGQLTASDYFTNNGGLVGIAGFGSINFYTAAIIKVVLNGTVGFDDLLYHNGDTDTYIGYSADRINFYCGGTQLLNLVEDVTDYVQFGAQLRVPDYIMHDGDTDTYIYYQTDRLTVVAGSITMLDIVEAGTDYVEVGVQLRVPDYIYHTGDLDTFIHFQTDQITIWAGLVQMIDIVETGATSYIEFGVDLIMQDGDWIGNSSTEARLYFDSSGATDYAFFYSCNVGIGTTTPDHDLHVYNSTVTSRIHSETGSTSSYAQLGVETDDGQWTIGTGGSAAAATYTQGNLYFYDSDAGAPRMVITDSGNVTIATTTTSPLGVLHVEESGGASNVVAFFGNDTAGQQDSTYIAGQTINVAYNADVDDALMWINYSGYQNSTTRHRDLTIADGKHNRIATFDGSSGYFGVGVVPSLGLVHIDQSSSTGTIPVLTLDQGDISEQCIEFRSDGVDRDIYLWTIDVTGTPSLMWDESENYTYFNKAFRATDLYVDDGGYIGANYTGGTSPYFIIDVSNNDIAMGNSTARFSVGGIVSPLAQVDFQQASSGGAIPVLKLYQADIDDVYIKFRGLTAASDLTHNLVREASVSTATRVGWFKIEIEDDTGGGIAAGDYYVPFYTLS